MSALPANLPVRADALEASGRRVFDVEIGALQVLRGRLGPAFANACQLLLDGNGRIACTGMGKSGHIAKKIAATLSSTRLASPVPPPGITSHGDLGMVTTRTRCAVVKLRRDEEILTISPR